MKDLPTRYSVALFLVSTTLLISCGLDEYTYLYPPINTSKTGYIYTFDNNQLNDPAVFIGYKLLYKFFPSTIKVDEEISNVTSRYTSSPTTIYQYMTGDLGFKDLKIGTSDDLKIDFANRPDPFTIQIDFTNAVLGYDPKNVIVSISDLAVSTTPGLPENAFRNVGQIGIGFSNEDMVFGYSDLVLEDNYSITGDTYLLLYVLAYGQNISGSTFSEVYSEPKYFIGTPNYLSLTVDQ